MVDEIELPAVAEIIMGQSPPGSTYNDDGSGLPFFQGVADFTDRHPIPRVYCTAPSRLARPGDILLSVRAPIGRVNVADRHCAIGRGLAIIRPRDPNEARYIEFALRYLEASWAAIEHSGSVFGNARRGDLEALRLPWPDPSRRQEVARTLGALDDKIEVNRRMARTLEELARAIFKAWFVDFDPVRAKAEGRRPLVPPELEDLFPSKLVDSPIGPIPKGWEVAPLGEHVEVVRGLSYRGADLVEAGEGLPLHNLNSVREGGGYKYEGIKWYAGDYKDRHLVEPGDVIVANTDLAHKARVIGYPAIVPRTFGEEGLFSADLFRVRPSEGSSVGRTFLYHALRVPRLRGAVVGYTGGTTVNHLSVEGLRRPTCVVPPSELTSAFDRLVRPMLDLEEQLVDESRTLARLRDWLLPKLISGQLRVREVV